ncbi:iron ABC transporter permease [Clostridium sp. D2Q-14]|uniref:FecCD family ABC transporter permease n=1 Tax=Anaeromonas gelatinilytica TaxID=2683194 RepID=UPI00193C755A|nr:iron ABC transporter permease [Anaeromonas gelatinilytica]
MSKKNDLKLYYLFIITIFFVLTLIVSMFIGRYSIDRQEYVNSIGNIKSHILNGTELNPIAMILFNVRLTRILMAALVGAGLSISGLVFQNVFKNPIASPDILGVTSGASFGAALAIILPVEFKGKIQILAFTFGVLAILITCFIKRMSRDESILYLVLSGIITSAFFTSLLSIMKYISDPYQQLPSIVFWTMGGLHRANWELVRNCIFIIIPSIILINKLDFKIKILSLGDTEAKSLGMNVSKFRNLILYLVSFVVSFCVSISGTIGWISLIVPHLSRILLGNDNKFIYLFTAIFGGTLLLILDNVARTLTTSEIPIGILTAMIGAPILGYLLIIKKTV